MAAELPTELIELIFSAVDPSDKKTCASICATNKLGQKVVTPLMYRNVGNATIVRYLPALGPTMNGCIR